ncbi:hypothetical protein MLD38_036876 [Melastoma candidum]|uniref:Uncharacterized protein n=2 Tax=Melastoma candidum TaxID=119954 RepID=A0ACB9LMV7_9MYRT|nr:hypothetical protein MLD38_036876 [Melastoma candidum]
MLVRSSAWLLCRQLSTSTAWRTQFQERKIPSQIAAIIQQRHNWKFVLESRELTSFLTSSTFPRVLRIVRSDPDTAITFYNYSVAYLSVLPDLRCKCIIMGCLIESGRVHQVRPVLDSVVAAYPVSRIIQTAIREGEGRDFVVPLLGLLMESYCDNCWDSDSLKVFKFMRNRGIEVPAGMCNVVLSCLLRTNEVKMGWCFYGATVRTGVVTDRSMWSLLARMLDKDGKIDRIAVLLDLGICTSVMYGIVIDWCCKIGDFAGAFSRLDEMGKRGFPAGFKFYSLILDGACRVRDADVTDRTVGMMVEKKMLPRSLSTEYDSVICRFCGLGKVYAAEMFYQKASNDGIELQSDTCGSLLKLFSDEGRMDEAVRMHKVISNMGSTVGDACYNSFVNVLCKNEALSEETTQMLGDLISRGYIPHGQELSKLFASGCRRRRWREVEDLLDIILDKDLLSLLDPSCCIKLVRHYFKTQRIHKAVALHNQMEVSNMALDERTYTLLIENLLKEDIETASRIFHYMKGKGLVSSTSFSVIIRGLCHLKEMKMAMKYHDEMLQMGLKPEGQAYKRLIAGFD